MWEEEEGAAPSLAARALPCAHLIVGEEEGLSPPQRLLPLTALPLTLYSPPCPPPFCPRQWTGTQTRTVPLPMWADEAALQVTEFAHGILTLQAPRRAGAAPFPQPRQLTIS